MSTMSLGTLYVRLSADATAAVSGFSKATAAVREYAEKVKGLAEPIAEAAATVTAMAAASVALAASVDSRAARSLKGLTDSSALLAIQVSDVLEPAVRSLSEMFRSAAGYVAGLDPALKSQIATWALWVVGIGAAAKAVAVLSGVLGAIAGIASGAASALLAVSAGPVAAIASVLAAVVLLHRAWRTNLGGIQDATREFATWMVGAFTGMAASIKGIFSDVIENTFAIVDVALQVAQLIERISGKKVGAGTNVDVLQALRSQWADTMKGGGGIANKALEYAKSVATSTGQAITDGFELIKNEALMMMGFDGKGFGFTSATPRGPGKDSGLVDMGALYDKEIQVLEDEKKRIDEYATLWNEVQNAEDARAKEQLADLDKLREAEKNADIWGSLAKDLKGWVTKAARQVADLMRAMGQQILSNMGALGATVNNVIQGAKSGGFWGAIVAAFLELANRMTGFQRMLKFFEQGIQVLADAFGPLIGWIFDFVSQITAVQTQGTLGAINALKPLFEGLADVFANLAPIFGVIMNLLKFLEPILNAFAKAIGAILKALGPVLKIIWEVVKYIVVALGGVIGAVIQVVNWVEQFIGWLIELFGDKKAAAEMRANMTDMDAYWQSLKDLAGSTWEQQAATDAATTGAWDAAIANKELAASTARVTEQLLNVPSGYKIAYARYAAMVEGLGGMTGGSTAPPGSAIGGGYAEAEPKTAPGNVNTGWSSRWKPNGNVWPKGLVADTGTSVNVYGDVNVNADTVDADSFSKKITRSNAVRNAQATGSWYARRGG